MTYVSPLNKKPLIEKNGVLISESGEQYPILGNIPRFVGSSGYAASFGLQWKKFQKTQLDSYNGTTISGDRLRRIVRGDLQVLKGKKTLEVGCGAGRFSEIFLNSGADLWCTDLSDAVDANFQNCSKYPGHHVCQADLRQLPFPYEFFDIVCCVGVIQHTPDSEQTIKELIKYLKPGGMLVIDHYSTGYGMGNLTRKYFRKYLLKKKPEYSLKFCIRMVNLLWPIHRFTWKIRNVRLIGRVRDWWLKVSPVVDYHWGFPQLTAEQLKEWAQLDTHDTLTDHFKTLKTEEEIRAILESNKMTDIRTECAGNGVEASALKTPGQY